LLTRAFCASAIGAIGARARMSRDAQLLELPGHRRAGRLSLRRGTTGRLTRHSGSDVHAHSVERVFGFLMKLGIDIVGLPERGPA
jgi:hypothetical protein